MGFRLLTCLLKSQEAVALVADFFLNLASVDYCGLPEDIDALFAPIVEANGVALQYIERALDLIREE